MDKPKVGEIYRHKKGKLYRILGFAVHTETEELLVIYADIYGADPNTWARPLTMFMEEGRFYKDAFCEIFDGSWIKR